MTFRTYAIVERSICRIHTDNVNLTVRSTLGSRQSSRPKRALVHEFKKNAKETYRRYSIGHLKMVI